VSSQRQTVVVIGAGHNGLVAACYLAKAGFAPLVLERRPVVGGSAVTEELTPGFLCPALTHSAGSLFRRIAEELQLDKHGLVMINPDVRVLAVDLEGRALRVYQDPVATANQLKRISPHDAQKFSEFHASLAQIRRVAGPLLSMTPPDVDHLKIEDYLNIGKLGLKFRDLDKKDAYRFLRWAPMAVADLVSEWFQTGLVQATIAARGVFGASAGPRSAGTSIGVLLQAAADGHAVAPALLAKGGAGAITQALAKAASAAGARIRTNAAVTHIRTNNGQAQGVVLSSGEEISASAVVSNADPRHTFLKLVDPAALDPSFLIKVRNYRCTGSAAKVNLALSGLPNFSEISEHIHIGPDIDYLERAFDQAKYHEFSPQPYMDITIPSLADPSLAPKGAHVMSIHVQYAPYELKDGGWNSRREEFGDAVVRALSSYAPNLGDLIVHRQIITPLDLEQSYGLSGGHIFHGEHSIDQFFAFRPFIGWAQYRTPIKRLYLCGAGTHPGGGLTGAPGANASREIIRDLRRT